ncbi:MAG: histidinol dehydrogenase, partial [Clostridia bacterium]|nr:histidinol dehydrogenase [Clostridia bacterium]
MIKIYEYGQVENKEIFARMAPKANVEKIVTDIINDVRENGDAALYRYCEKFDGAKLDGLEVTKAEFDEALAVTEPEFLRILESAAKNIRLFHEQQKRQSFVVSGEKGALLGQRVLPIEKAGLYVPGGTAAYPSTVLMDSIPAKIAGVEEIVMVTPPSKNGKVNPAILSAAYIAGVDRVFKIGGAQAVAALAYGTESVPQVDKIVGPGNAFVA